MTQLAKLEMQPLATVDDAKNYMWSAFRQIQSLVKDKAKADRQLAIGLHCIEQNPRLLDCPRSSFRNSLVEAARLDLEPNSVQQFCWIIPRALKRGERPIARLEVGYRGLIQLVRRDGGIKDIWALGVDEADEFVREEGTRRGIVHRQENQMRDGRVENLVGAYACALLHNNVTTYKVMDREQLDAARKLSKSSAYDGPFAMEMYLKTPIKRLCKTLPLKDPRVAEVIDLEDEKENIVPDPVEEVEVVEVAGEPEPERATKPMELPKETRAEINLRIKGNWDLLTDMDAIPVLKKAPVEHYVSIDCEDSVALEFANYLSVKVLEAERDKR